MCATNDDLKFMLHKGDKYERRNCKETEGRDLLLRFAKTLKNYVKQLPVAMLAYEFIIRRPNTWLIRWGGGR